MPKEHRMSKTRVAAFALAACLLTPAGARGEAQTPPPSSGPSYVTKARQLIEEYDREKVLGQIRELYEQAKASGERVPADLLAWAREDAARIGAWEYRVVKTSGQEPAALESELNALGRERWECVSISPEARGKQSILVLKRPMKSYLGRLNLRDVMHVLADRN